MAHVGRLAEAAAAVRPRLGVAARAWPAYTQAAEERIFPQAFGGGNQVRYTNHQKIDIRLKNIALIHLKNITESDSSQISDEGKLQLLLNFFEDIAQTWTTHTHGTLKGIHQSLFKTRDGRWNAGSVDLKTIATPKMGTLMVDFSHWWWKTKSKNATWLPKLVFIFYQESFFL